MSGRAGTRRVFYALWPDDAVRDAIVHRRRALDDKRGRPVPDHNLHATLVFVGDQPAELVETLVADDRPAQTAGFELLLDRFGWFARARVAWLGGPAAAGGLELVAALVARVAQLGVRTERRRWLPHVTLLRKVARFVPPSPPEPLAWPVGGFALVESIPNRPYQVLRTWRLQ